MIAAAIQARRVEIEQYRETQKRNERTPTRVLGAFLLTSASWFHAGLRTPMTVFLTVLQNEQDQMAHPIVFRLLPAMRDEWALYRVAMLAHPEVCRRYGFRLQDDPQWINQFFASYTLHDLFFHRMWFVSQCSTAPFPTLAAFVRSVQELQREGIATPSVNDRLIAQHHEEANRKPEQTKAALERLWAWVQEQEHLLQVALVESLTKVRREVGEWIDKWNVPARIQDLVRYQRQVHLWVAAGGFPRAERWDRYQQVHGEHFDQYVTRPLRGMLDSKPERSLLGRLVLGDGRIQPAQWSEIIRAYLANAERTALEVQRRVDLATPTGVQEQEFVLEHFHVLCHDHITWEWLRAVDRDLLGSTMSRDPEVIGWRDRVKELYEKHLHAWTTRYRSRPGVAEAIVRYERALVEKEGIDLAIATFRTLLSYEGDTARIEHHIRNIAERPRMHVAGPLHAWLHQLPSLPEDESEPLLEDLATWQEDAMKSIEPAWMKLKQRVERPPPPAIPVVPPELYTNWYIDARVWAQRPDGLESSVASGSVNPKMRSVLQAYFRYYIHQLIRPNEQNVGAIPSRID